MRDRQPSGTGAGHGAGEAGLRISGNWRPYRTWATLLLRTYLEDQTYEIAGQPA